jgi:hypothetical protein
MLHGQLIGAWTVDIALSTPVQVLLYHLASSKPMLIPARYIQIFMHVHCSACLSLGTPTQQQPPPRPHPAARGRTVSLRRPGPV